MFLGLRCLAVGRGEDIPGRSYSFAIAQSQGRARWVSDKWGWDAPPPPASASSGPAQPLLPALRGHGARASGRGCECAVSTRLPSGSAWSAGPPMVAPTRLPEALGPLETLLAAFRPRGIVFVERVNAGMKE